MHDEIGDSGAVGGGRLELFDDVPGGVELGRQALDHPRRSRRRVREIEAGRLQEAFDLEERVVTALVGRDDADGGVVGQGQGLAVPPTVRSPVEHQRPASDVLVGGDNHAVLGEVHILDGLPWARGHQHLHGPGPAVLEVVQVRGHQGALADGRRPGHGRPILLQGEEQLPAVQPYDGRLQRQRQLHRACRRQQIGFRLEEADRPVDQHRAAAGLGVEGGVRRHPDVLGRAAEHLLRLIQRLAPLQQLHHEGVAGLGHRIRSPLPGDDQGVRILPGELLLAARQGEAALDEPGVWHVELPHVEGVFPAVGEGHQAELFLGRQTAGALPDPGLALGLGKGVEVEHRLPGGIGALVTFGSRAPPEPLHVGPVLPEVVDPARAEARHRDAVGGVDDLQRLLVQHRVARIGLEDVQRTRILGLGPVQGARAVGLFQPDERISGVGRGVGHGRRGLGRGHRGGEGADRQGQEKGAHGRLFESVGFAAP